MATNLFALAAAAGGALLLYAYSQGQASAGGGGITYGPGGPGGGGGGGGMNPNLPGGGGGGGINPNICGCFDANGNPIPCASYGSGSSGCVDCNGNPVPCFDGDDGSGICFDTNGLIAPCSQLQGAIPPMNVGGGAWLPGDNHDYDNEFVYAAGQVLNDAGAMSAATWLFALTLKAIAWREAGRSWSWNPGAHNFKTPQQEPPHGEDSRGLMQINVEAHAHPEWANVNLYDPNTCIYYGALVLIGCWTGDPYQVSCYNADPGYQADVGNLARQLQAMTPQAQGA